VTAPIRTCIACKVTFVPTTTKATVCSTKCRMRLYRMRAKTDAADTEWIKAFFEQKATDPKSKLYAGSANQKRPSIPDHPDTWFRPLAKRSMPLCCLLPTFPPR
jgi:hypothetical protein